MTTIRQTIETILGYSGVSPIADTVDTVKSGDPERELTGIVTTFLATHEVIAQAAAMGANLIITHEPTYYNHRDEVGWLAGDPIYSEKTALLNSHGIVVWRFHDYWHQVRPDGILTGLKKALGWEQFTDPLTPVICTVPPISLQTLLALFSERLSLDFVRFVAPPEVLCNRVALFPGSWPAEQQIRAYTEHGVDTVVAGEIHEWEIGEYVRDAVSLGKQQSLVILGHQASEEPGMSYLAEWLQPALPGVRIIHIPARQQFQLGSIRKVTTRGESPRG